MVEVVKRAWTNHRVLVEENFTQSKGDAWGERYVVQGAVTDHVPILWDNFRCSHVIL